MSTKEKYLTSLLSFNPNKKQNRLKSYILKSRNFNPNTMNLRNKKVNPKKAKPTDNLKKASLLRGNQDKNLQRKKSLQINSKI